MAAGAGAIRFNSPLSDDRAESLVASLAERDVRSVVDLGCGRGALALLTGERLPNATIEGVDSDSVAITHAQELADTAGLGDRVRFTAADAATWSGTVDAALCIGASHIFGDAAAMFARLAERVPNGVAIVGDGVWQGSPDPWCLETFGDMPDGVDGLAAMAATAGWTVDSSDLSTLDEWDAFELGWVDGVRAVGSPTADGFATKRAAEYQNYRSVLGFAWLRLSR